MPLQLRPHRQILPHLKDCIWLKALKSYQSLQNKLSGYRKRKFLFSYLSQVYSLHRQLPAYIAKAHIHHHFRQKIVIIPRVLSFLSAQTHGLNSSVRCWPGSLQSVSQVFLLTNSQLGSAVKELGAGGRLLIALFQKHQIPPMSCRIQGTNPTISSFWGSSAGKVPDT